MRSRFKIQFELNIMNNTTDDITTKVTIRNQVSPSGIPFTTPNLVTPSKIEDFYISYNNTDRGVYGSDTTAVVVGNMSGFFILNGDHRKDLVNKTWLEVYNYMLSLEGALISKFSDPFRCLSNSLEDTINNCRKILKKSS